MESLDISTVHSYTNWLEWRVQTGLDGLDDSLDIDWWLEWRVQTGLYGLDDSLDDFSFVDTS